MSTLCQKVFEMGRKALKDPLHYDITMADFMEKEKFEEIRSSKAYRQFADYTGLASIKVILGMFTDSQTGLHLSTSVLTRGFSLGIHTATSKKFTSIREYIYDKGNITEDRNSFWKYGAEILSQNLFQNPLYTFQVGVIYAGHSFFNDSIDFDPQTLVKASYMFFINSAWMAPAAKYMMNSCRRFFGAKTPDQLVEIKEQPF